MADLVDSSCTRVRVDPGGAGSEPVITEACLSRLVAARRVGDPRAVRRCGARDSANRIGRRCRGRVVEDDLCQQASADAATTSTLAGLRRDDSSRALARVETGVSVGTAVRDLGTRDRRIMTLRFVGELSKAEIAARMNVSRMQVLPAAPIDPGPTARTTRVTSRQPGPDAVNPGVPIRIGCPVRPTRLSQKGFWACA